MSSIFAALTVAVGGMSAQSSAIGNVSDNLANSQTTGFKGINTRFSSLVTSSTATNNDPGGVRATPYYTNSQQGNLVDSSSATSLAISGSGYFAVRDAIINADGTTSFGGTTYFTRAGDFNLNKDGYLVNGSGYYLSGYDVDENGNVNTSVAEPVQISQLLDNPVATSSITYAANLPSGASSTYVSSASTIQVYDSLGDQHNASFVWNKSATTNQWTLDITIAGAATDGSGNDLSISVPFTFNDGSTNTAGTMETIGAGTGYSVLAAATGAAQISVPTSFVGAGSQTVTISFGTYNKSDGVTQFADSSNAVSVSSFDQNGIARGSFQDLSIDQNGFVSLNYDNGQSRIIAQIPIVQFFAEDKLQRMSGGVYAQTLDSGTARYSIPGKNGSGTVVCNALESSNVDIATEFTKLIQAQRVYSANAKTVTTADSMLQDVINIIR